MCCFDRMQQWQHADVCSSGCEVFGVFCGLYEVHWVSLTGLKCMFTKHCLDALSELIHQRTLLSCALRCETFFVVCTCAVVGRFNLYNMNNTLSAFMFKCFECIKASMHLAVVCIEVWGIWRFGELLNWTKQFTPKVKNSTADRAFVNSLELICTEKKSRKSSTVQCALWIHKQYVLKQIKQLKAENEKHSQHTLLNLSAFCVEENNTTGTVTSKHVYTKQSDTITV